MLQVQYLLRYSFCQLLNLKIFTKGFFGYFLSAVRAHNLPKSIDNGL